MEALPNFCGHVKTIKRKYYGRGIRSDNTKDYNYWPLSDRKQRWPITCVILIAVVVAWGRTTPQTLSGSNPVLGITIIIIITDTLIVLFHLKLSL